jgi:1,4-dihydroxy-2-naphthoate octaprenyltransferase
MFWLRAARAPFFTGSLAPILVGSAVGYWEAGELHWLRAIVALLSLTLLHASANLANDFFDYLSGNDDVNTTFASPFTGGSRVIQLGLVQPWEMMRAAAVCMALAVALGMYLVWQAGWLILALGVFGGLTGLLYTMPPVKLAYRGGGELFIFLDFGLLPVVGAAYLQTGALSLSALAAGIPVALLITAILWINQFQDAEADAAVAKRHWVVRLGRRRSAGVHTGLLAATYLAVVGAIGLGLLPPWAALALGALPLVAIAAVTALRHYDDLPRLTPANAATIAAHLLTSLLLALGLILAS